jgi:hypothetical protein
MFVREIGKNLWWNKVYVMKFVIAKQELINMDEKTSGQLWFRSVYGLRVACSMTCREGPLKQETRWTFRHYEMPRLLLCIGTLCRNQKQCPLYRGTTTNEESWTRLNRYYSALELSIHLNFRKAEDENVYAKNKLCCVVWFLREERRLWVCKLAI